MELGQYFIFAMVYCIGAHVGATPASAVYDYLKKYGYLSEEESNNSGQMAKALTKFQQKMGVRADGKFNSVTQKLMGTSRCGERDMNLNQAESNVLIEKIRGTGVLKYSIKEWTKWLPRTIQNQTVYNAIKLWAVDLEVKVLWTKESPDVNIVFRPAKKRGIASLHDVLTEVKMVDNVNTIFFYSKASRSLNTLIRTAAHSFGHIFGHQHSDLYSLMSPIVRSSDILSHRKCEISLTGAFNHLKTGKSYLVKNDLVWKTKLDDMYSVVYPPVKVSHVFRGIPENFDDAFTWYKNYETYFFKGSRYWRIKFSQEADDGYPRPISEGWPGVPDDIDAVFLDLNFETHFFKGDLTYKYNDTIERVADGYPKKIDEEFDGLPASKFDAVFHYYTDDIIWFFKGLFYWKMSKESGIQGPYRTMYDWKNLCLPDGNTSL